MHLFSTLEEEYLLKRSSPQLRFLQLQNKLKSWVTTNNPKLEGNEEEVQQQPP